MYLNFQKIRDVIKEIEEVSRELATVLQGIHLEKSATEGTIYLRYIEIINTLAFM